MPRLRSTIKFNLFLLLICMVLFAYGGCSLDGLFQKAEALVEEIAQPRTPRENFARNFDWEISGGERAEAEWINSFAVSDTQGLKISLPHREVLSSLRADSLSAQSFRFTLPAGRTVTIQASYDTSQVFGELYRTDWQGRRDGNPVAIWEDRVPILTYEPRRGRESLVFAFQSLPGTRVSAQKPVEITFTSEAALLFPVAGKDERAIKSFWGDRRGGGRRKHRGNDIFAPKGTPLLAVADGRIRKVGNGGLGGKTVWLQDRKRGQSYYYAHLDEQYVRRGQNVKRGDTLGTVGNTGNARTTPPHLHFGVYANGAYDPNPLLRADDELPPRTSVSATRGPHHTSRTPPRQPLPTRATRTGR